MNKAKIVRAARTVARKQGIHAVTIRGVAVVLDVTPMALYRYIDSSTNLRHATIDFLLLPIPGPPAAGSVSDRLHEWAHEARRVLRMYPGLAEVCLAEWVTLRQGCRIMEGLLATAEDHTKQGGEQVAIANACFVYVLSRVAVERSVSARGRSRSLPAVEAEPDRFPRLVQHRFEFSNVNADRHFAIGLDALLTGLLTSE